MKALHITVSGRVQGVFFRASAKQEADRLGLSGRVCNEPDGSVSIDVQGDEKALSHFMAWCHHGPSGARVAKVRAEEMNPKTFQGFIVDRSTS